MVPWKNNAVFHCERLIMILLRESHRSNTNVQLSWKKAEQIEFTWHVESDNAEYSYPLIWIDSCEIEFCWLWSLLERNIMVKETTWNAFILFRTIVPSLIINPKTMRWWLIFYTVIRFCNTAYRMLWCGNQILQLMHPKLLPQFLSKGALMDVFALIIPLCVMHYISEKCECCHGQGGKQLV